MPALNRNNKLASHRRRAYPFGVGDGTRIPQVGDAEDMGPVDDTNGANGNEATAKGSNVDDAQNNFDDGRSPYGVGEGGVEAEQIISLQPDQLIKLVVGTPDVKKEAKKEHPQNRIEKFWANFEPEYLGGITQILPDTVSESTLIRAKTSEKNPKAVHSYDNARASCIKSVKRIIRECRSNNQKYTDPHFDLERDLKVTKNRDCLYGLESWDDSKNPGDVKRVTDVFEHPQFFKDGADFDDIVQGVLGDCWFLAGLSAITANQELLRKVCVIQDQDVGVYGFVFHRDGDWHPCIIDDKLYLSAPSFDESGDTVLEQYGVKQAEQEKVYIETQQRGSKALFFASCRDDNETWVPLLEKAYAKAHGDFTALDGGQVGEALEDLTGGVTTEIYTTNILNKEDYWRDLCRIGKDFIFSCHVSIYAGWRGVNDDFELQVRGRRLKGIVESHAYSVLATYEGYGQKLVKIRNPWGEREWSGPWSDGSKEWTADWLHRLDHKFGDDGVFWMSYEDMLRRYKYMDRTRLFGPEWYIVQEWASVQVPWNSRDYQSTTFSIEATEDTDAVIVLSQLDDRFFRGFEGPYGYTLSFRVQKVGEDEDEDDYFARSPVNYELRRSTNVEVRLEKGKYTVLVKVEATKYGNKDIETVIRENTWRREKLTQMATLYDLAFRKGKLPPIEKKKEEEAKPVETTSTAAEELKKPDTQAETATNGEKTEEKKEEDKTETKAAENAEEKQTDVTTPTTTTTEDVPAAATPTTTTTTTSTEEQKEEKAPEPENETGQQTVAPTPTPKPTPESNETIPAVMATAMSTIAGGVYREVEAAQTTEPAKIVPDENDPNRNPWNASCVLGLRVYSKLSDLQLKVYRPGDKPDGVTLDRDDIARSALVEAEKAQEKQQA